ncbi:MAG: hypothetical protein C0592_05610 [Marinilabiliales bacterium]|nr:MAG: hypothetical protein C0592_05610 [Marinilabiliales bacterium]
MLRFIIMKYTLLIIISLLLFACSSGNKEEEYTIPKDSVFTEEQMEAILFDMYLAETYIRQQEREGQNNRYYSEHYYNLMFEKHHTDSLKMHRSYLWYAARPELLKEINQRVLDSLIIMETTLPPAEE